MDHGLQYALGWPPHKRVAESSEGGVAPRRAPRLAGDSLLRQEAGRGDHGEAAVGELLLLHQPELLRVGRLEAQRVETEVAGVVALAQRLRGGRRLRVELLPALGDADLLG